MGKIRELFTDTLVYGISSVVARFINYLLVPFYTKFFDPAAYGIIGLIYGAIIFLNVLFTFGMESSYLRYGADRARARDVFKTIQGTLLTGATFLVLLSWLAMPLLAPLVGLSGAETADSAAGAAGSGATTSGIHHFTPAHLFYFMLGILWLDALCMVPFAELRLIRKSMLYAMIRLMNVCINVTLNLWLVIAGGWGIEAVLVSNLVASGVTVLVLFLYTSHMYTGTWKVSHMKTALLFGIPYIPAGLSHAVNEVFSRFAVNNMPQESVTRLYGSGYTADDITGIFNACYKLSVFMLMAVQMFRMAWMPFFMRRAGDTDAKKTFADVFTLFNVAAAGVFVFVGLFAGQLVRVPVPLLDGTLIDERYWMGLFIVPWLLMAYWLQGWFLNFMSGVFIKEKMWALSGITMVGACVTIAGNLWLVPLHGMQGAVWVTLASFASMAGLMYYLASRVYAAPYKMKLNLMVLMGAGLVVALGNGFATDFFEPLFAKVVLFVLCLIVLTVVGLKRHDG